MPKRKSSKVGKVKNIPMPGIDGKSRSRRRQFDEAGKSKGKRATNRRAPDETPLCRHCITNGRSKPNRVRRGPFGEPLQECDACLAAAGGRAHKALAEMPSMLEGDE